MNNQKSFTLIEILVYIAVLAIITVAISSFFLWFIHSNTKTRAMRETLDNARRAMEIMTYEIKEAKSIYTPTTVSTQLSLESTKHLPEEEKTTYVDFYLCGTQLCFRKEPSSFIATSSKPIALTSNSVEVKNLIFSEIATTSTKPSVQINLKVDYKNPANRPEYQSSVNLTSTASLRSY